MAESLNETLRLPIRINTMKRNLFGILLFVLTLVNAAYMLYFLFTADLDLKNTLYIVAGTLVSALILLFLIQNKVYGYSIALIFNALQIIGTPLLFDNFRYGLIFRLEFETDFGNLDVNFTALLLTLLSLWGYQRYKKQKVIKQSTTTS